MSSKIIAVGDLHCEFGMLNKLISSKRPDIVLQCGDFGWWPHMHNKFWDEDSVKVHDQYCIKAQGAKIYWCDGNHENHDDIAQRLKESEGPYEFAGTNVFYQPRGSILTLPDGRNVVFFGGAESIDKHMRREGVSWWRGELPTQRDYEEFEINMTINCIEQSDIMITHTAPKCITEELGFHSGAKVLDPTVKFFDHVLEKYRPKKWFFGHFHIPKTGKTAGCSWTALNSAHYHRANWWCWV